MVLEFYHCNIFVYKIRLFKENDFLIWGVIKMNDENQIYDLLEKVYIELQETKKEFREELKDIKGEIKDIKGDIKGIQGDIRDIKEELRDFKAETKENFNGLNSKIDDLVADLSLVQVVTGKNMTDIAMLKAVK